MIIPEPKAENAAARAEILSKYRFDDTVNHLIFVSRFDGSLSLARHYCKEGGAWKALEDTVCFIGKNGIGKTREGDLKTPSGELRVKSAFGICPNPGVSLKYIQLTPSTIACDEEGPFYNKIVDSDCGGERMFDYSPQYNYGLETDYNSACEYPLGSAIFIHCKGEKHYTGGCIAFDEPYMRDLLRIAHCGLLFYVGEY